MNMPVGHKTSPLPYERRKQILLLLLNHGPLSLNGFELLLAPPISRRRLNDSLCRLYRRGLLLRRYGRTARGGGAYHMLNGRKSSRKKLARILGVDFEELQPPRLRRTEMFHSETCSLWCEMLKRLLPQAQILREHQFKSDPKYSALFGSLRKELDLAPEILVIVPARQGSVIFAIENERIDRTEEKLLRKLRKYAARTQLDGLIYLCEGQELFDQLRHIYLTKAQVKLSRLRHSSHNFFMFSAHTIFDLNTAPQLINPEFDLFPLREWVSVLCARKMAKPKIQNSQPLALPS